MNNIYQVLSANDVNEILSKYPDKLIITLCTSKTLKYKESKKRLYAESINKPECIFLYIEYENFTSQTTLPLDNMPLYIFFYQNERMHTLNNFNEISITKHIDYLQNIITAIIDDNNNNIIQQENNIDIDDNKNKNNKNNDDKQNIFDNIKKSNKEISKHNEESSDEENSNKYIKDKLLKTNKKYKELEQLEKLVELKKLKAIQEFENNEKEVSSNSYS